MQAIDDFFKSNRNNLRCVHVNILLKPEKLINLENSIHWSVSIIKQKYISFFNCCLPKSFGGQLIINCISTDMNVI